MDNLQDVLAARYFLYSTFQTLTGNEPTSAVLDGLSPELVEGALELVGVADAEALAGSFESARQAGLADMKELAALYTKLFVGPVKLAAPPWESVYRSNSRALFQRTTLDVRNAYREQGLLPEMYPRVADDHIALELGFLAALAKRALDADAAGGHDALSVALEASKRFLTEHLSLWVGDYCRDLGKQVPDSLFGALAAMLVAFVRADAAFLR